MCNILLQCYFQSVTLLQSLLNYIYRVKLDPCEKCAKCDFDKKCWNVEMNRKISSEWVQPAPYLSCISEMLRWAQKYAERPCSPSQIRNWEIKIGKYLLDRGMLLNWMKESLVKVFSRIFFPIWCVTSISTLTPIT